MKRERVLTLNSPEHSTGRWRMVETTKKLLSLALTKCDSVANRTKQPSTSSYCAGHKVLHKTWIRYPTATYTTCTFLEVTGNSHLCRR